MNNGDVGGSRGRGRGWNSDNQPRELRRPKTVTEEVKGMIPSRKLVNRFKKNVGQDTSFVRYDAQCLGESC